MTVLSIMAGGREGNLLRHPLDLTQCVRTSRPTPKGKKVQIKIQSVQHSRVSSASQGGAECVQDAMAFIFCAKEVTMIPCNNVSMDAAAAKENKDDSIDHSIAGVKLPPFELGHLGLLLPAAVATHGGLYIPAGAAIACLPIMAPFRIPQVSPDSWMANKRALAFHRCCVLGVYIQGAFALLRFSSGDLIGGVYLGIQAAMGAYAITPEGVGFMPSYMMVSGFNGLLGIIQVFQSFQGVPLHYIPFSALLPPAISLLSCYWGWQFCKELRAIGAGMIGDGPQDTCWVKFMGGDIWPISSLSPVIETSERDRDRGGESFTGGVSNRFSAFGGSGHRLGEGEN